MKTDISTDHDSDPRPFINIMIIKGFDQTTKLTDN